MILYYFQRWASNSHGSSKYLTLIAKKKILLLRLHSPLSHCVFECSVQALFPDLSVFSCMNLVCSAFFFFFFYRQAFWYFSLIPSLWFDPCLFVDLPLPSVFVLLLPLTDFLCTDFASVNKYLFFGFCLILTLTEGSLKMSTKNESFRIF